MEQGEVNEKLHQLILELEAEKAETETQIQNYENEILQAKYYLQSLYEKEDTDVMIFFSPQYRKSVSRRY